MPQSSVLPQPSMTIPQVLFCEAQVLGVQVVAQVWFRHVCGAVQLRSLQQLPVTQVPLQLIIPAPHPHTPLVQVSPPVHCALVQQLVLGMQLPLQSWSPAGHAHVPPWHVWPPRQSPLPQQLPNGMHAPLQALSPAGHAHTPDWQVLPPEQSVFVQQLVDAMHALAQSLSPC